MFVPVCVLEPSVVTRKPSTRSINSGFLGKNKRSAHKIEGMKWSYKKQLRLRWVKDGLKNKQTNLQFTLFFCNIFEAHGNLIGQKSCADITDNSFAVFVIFHPICQRLNLIPLLFSDVKTNSVVVHAMKINVVIPKKSKMSRDFFLNLKHTPLV